jgi:hypothetical protein
LPHDGIQIDEHLSAQQRIELRFARSVDTHQAAQGDRFVRRVMIDVHAGEAGAPLDDEVDELLERRALFVEIVGPKRAVTLAAAEMHAEKILESALR